ncbi:MAG: HD domain-containing protein [Spirochaetaceae bacterium]|jgi:HD superfamily phosphohydrolase|nr:HD domain-containing protein [Spirochaetaceae bacterium]
MNNTARAALQEGYTEPVRDVLWGHVYLTPALAALLRSHAFTRLSRIFQLGPAYGVYPGATHTRAAHSIGVYHLARRLLLNLAERGADSWFSALGVRSFLCAGLLHDLGHFPYTHSLKELSLIPHEILTANLIRAEPLRSLVGAAGADPDMTAAIVDTRESGGADSQDGELSFYRRLLSGVLDPDKLDYLNRDARYCGVPYGAQDVDYIYSRLHPHLERGVDIDSRGIPSVEAVLFSKYLMYRTVYWHRSVRSSTAMIKTAVLAGLRDGIFSEEALYNLDDQGLFGLLAEGAHPRFSLARQVRDGCCYAAAAEFPFIEAEHGYLMDITARFRYEEALAEKLSRFSGGTGAQAIGPGELIIDIPEPVSFETGLYVRDEGCYFTESSGVFSKDVVEGFIKSLRIIRIFIDPVHENRVQLHKTADILYSYKRWLC